MDDTRYKIRVTSENGLETTSYYFNNYQDAINFCENAWRNGEGVIKKINDTTYKINKKYFHSRTININIVIMSLYNQKLIEEGNLNESYLKELKNELSKELILLITSGKKQDNAIYAGLLEKIIKKIEIKQKDR